MKRPQLKKVVFISLKKRPKEALFEFCKNTFFKCGLVVYSWISYK
ncbi:hypothetical protein HJ01_00429 [Flavobacterium frigoris PS1]|uniref:Uncharacterized protein n=1 Tax=Flavobacterium frigoris (strain PS1) TaxID=1086011 RepID=H7FMG0_FLAFP|nr:hypothetical protein HJ01_00429 [Flavobacterium frigoris PS1]